MSKNLPKNNLHARSSSSCIAIVYAMHEHTKCMMNSQMKDEHLFVWKCDKKFLNAYSTWLGIPTAGPAEGETAPAPGSGPDLVSFFKAENIAGSSGFVSNSARRSRDVFFFYNLQAVELVTDANTELSIRRVTKPFNTFLKSACSACFRISIFWHDHSSWRLLRLQLPFNHTR